MTEEEARKKWCPMIRFNYCEDGITDDNRGMFAEAPNCLASDCAVWRWVRDDYARGWEPKETHEDYNKGYCGLGGRI